MLNEITNKIENWVRDYTNNEYTSRKLALEIISYVKGESEDEILLKEEENNKKK